MADGRDISDGRLIPGVKAADRGGDCAVRVISRRFLPGAAAALHSWRSIRIMVEIRGTRNGKQGRAAIE